MNNMLEKIFKLRERGTDVKTEVLAGVATFLTMAYIIVVNPAILSKTGMPFSGVLFATVLVCAFSSIAMGLYANLPYGVAPGMGINAFFTFTLVLGMGVRWETALGAVFISGIIFIILSVTGVRTEIVRAIPNSLRYGVAVGIGIFLALIGLESVGFIVSKKATVVGFGNLSLSIVLFLVGLILTSILMIKNIRGALIIGITATSVIALIASVVGMSAGWLARPIVTIPEGLFALPTLDVFFKLDIAGALSVGMILPVFTLLFTDMFDSISTFLGVAEVAGLIDKNGQPVNVEKALLTDAFSTTISGFLGSSSGTTYIESAVGVGEGGRTGLTAVIIGLLFLPFMFLSPLLSFIPAVATAPILVLVGVFMTQPLMKIDWKNFEEAIPAFLAVILVPLTYSITQGIIWGFLTYTIIKLFLGKGREVHWMLYIIDVFAILSLVSPML
ncbi:MAG: NCS2 family permease [Thermodesulfobacteriota bacterium]|nr:NCS2 family permease [Thermodesulfobacteriota bacterium]